MDSIRWTYERLETIPVDTEEDNFIVGERNLPIVDLSKYHTQKKEDHSI